MSLRKELELSAKVEELSAEVSSLQRNLRRLERKNEEQKEEITRLTKEKEELELAKKKLDRELRQVRLDWDTEKAETQRTIKRLERELDNAKAAASENSSLSRSSRTTTTTSSYSSSSYSSQPTNRASGDDDFEKQQLQKKVTKLQTQIDELVEEKKKLERDLRMKERELRDVDKKLSEQRDEFKLAMERVLKEHEAELKTIKRTHLSSDETRDLKNEVEELKKKLELEARRVKREQEEAELKVQDIRRETEKSNQKLEIVQKALEESETIRAQLVTTKSRLQRELMSAKRQVYNERLRHVPGTRPKPMLLRLYKAENLSESSDSVVRVRQVELSASSLRSGDVYVLDIPEGILFQWVGGQADESLKRKAKELIRRLNNKRSAGSRARRVVLMEGKEDTKQEAQEFWATLRGRRGEPNGLADAHDGEESDVRLYRGVLRERERKEVLELEEVGRGTLRRHQLADTGLYVVDTPGENMYIWLGRDSPLELRGPVVLKAKAAFAASPRPAWASLRVTKQDKESVLFQEKFVDWPYAGSAASAREELFDVHLMHAAPLLADDDSYEDLRDDGTGPVVVYQATHTANAGQPDRLGDTDRGRFFSGESYIVVYRDDAGHYVVYTWQGRHSPEPASAAMVQAVQRGLPAGSASHVEASIRQGKEPMHFLALFRGMMVVHAGAAADYSPSQVALYHIRGADPFTSKAVQTAVDATSLNSYDSFFLTTPAALYVWHGERASLFTRGIAVKVAERLGLQASGEKERKVQELEEGAETNLFWTSLGGKKPYGKSSHAKAGWVPRMFVFCNDSTNVREGLVRAEYVPILPTVDDLDESKILLVDAFVRVYVWVGAKVTDQAFRDKAIETANRYVTLAQDGRDVRPVVIVEDGKEPFGFILNFHGWVSRARGVATESAAAAAPATNDPYIGPYEQYYTLDQLKARDCPTTVDERRLEAYLAPEEFMQVFNMDKKTFYETLSEWQQSEAKKRVGLF